MPLQNFTNPPKSSRAVRPAKIRQHHQSPRDQKHFCRHASWKYSGWCGQVYDKARYEWHGKFAESRFNRDCLTEYAEVFKTVCVDAAYYKFPDQRYLEGMVSQVPEDFRFAFKVTDEITLKRFTNLPRHGPRAGKSNENFLNAELFTTAFLKPCEEFKKNIGLLMFEFSHFYQSDFARGRDFVAALDQFLAGLPPGWPYGIEIRNKHFLHPEYFAMLRKHGVAHIYNSWTDMPSVAEQMRMPESQTTQDLIGARFLLKPGRKYEDAVKRFTPYTETREQNHDARTAGATLIKESLGTQPRRGAYIFVNNRLEGNAPMTILSMMERAGVYELPDRAAFTMRTTFATLPTGTHFYFHGRRYLKIAKNMTEDVERNSHIFQDEAEVEIADPSKRKHE